MQTAARAHVSSLRWRLATGLLFAVGAALTLNSFRAGSAWYLAVALSMCFDSILGHSYLSTRAKDRNGAGGLFVWGCAFSSAIFVAMPLYLVAEGGGAGRVLGVLMAASAFVRVMLFLSRARTFMIIVGAPAILCLMAMPFIPLHNAQVLAVQGALGVACGVVAFLAYVLRAAMAQNKTLDSLAAAHERARAGWREAEIKRAESEEAGRVKSQFLGVMTHELRTPLNAVIGYAELLGEDAEAAGLQESRADAQRIAQAGRHLLGMIDQILHLTSADASLDGGAESEFDVRELVEACLAAHQDELSASGVGVIVRVDALGPVRADRAKLGVCLNALISNAVKFTDRGRIVVNAQCNDREGQAWLEIAVSDTGRGIAAEERERVFQPFVRGLDAVRQLKAGAGLGLAVALRNAEAIGGRIDLESQLGAGSTFTLRAPVAITQAAAVAA